MSILEFNGKEIPISLPVGTPVMEIIERHLDEHIPPDQVVSSVCIDGDNQGRPEATWGDIEKLSIVTAPPADLVLNGLESSKEVTRDIARRLRLAAEQLRRGEMENFRQLFVKTIDDLLSFLQFLSMSHIFLGNKKSAMEKFQDNLKEQVSRILDAQQRIDTVLLADLLEYELSPIFDGWESVRTSLIKTIQDEAANA